MLRPLTRCPGLSSASASGCDLPHRLQEPVHLRRGVVQGHPHPGPPRPSPGAPAPRRAGPRRSVRPRRRGPARPGLGRPPPGRCPSTVKDTVGARRGVRKGTPHGGHPGDLLQLLPEAFRQSVLEVPQVLHGGDQALPGRIAPTQGGQVVHRRSGSHDGRRFRVPVSIR